MFFSILHAHRIMESNGKCHVLIGEFTFAKLSFIISKSKKLL